MTKTEALELELAARKMVEGTVLEWEDVIRRSDTKRTSTVWILAGHRETYELALGIVEGKPVWEGDELWHSTEGRVIANSQWGKEMFNHNGRICYVEHLSWNPPKPKTVTVELPIQLVELYANNNASGIHTIDLENLFNLRNEACRKALEVVK